jgi:hypothetical protein
MLQAGTKFIQALKYSTAVNEPIFTTLTITTIFEHNSSTEFHVNPTNSLAADTTGHTHGRTFSFLLLKERLTKASFALTPLPAYRHGSKTCPPHSKEHLDKHA